VTRGPNAARLRQPYQRGQEEQIGALGLVVNCIVLYNTIYTHFALTEMIRRGEYRLPKTPDLAELASA
jgi:TnpA family transposase